MDRKGREVPGAEDDLAGALLKHAETMFGLLDKLSYLAHRHGRKSGTDLQPYMVAPPEVLREVKSKLRRRLAERFKRGFDSTPS